MKSYEKTERAKSLGHGPALFFSPRSCKKETPTISIWLQHGYFPMLLNIDNLGNRSWNVLNPFPNKAWFLRVYSTSLFKTQGEKENFLQFSSNLKFSSTNSVSVEESKICRLGKD